MSNRFLLPLFIVLCFSFNIAQGSAKSDSLFRELKTVSSDTSKVMLLKGIGEYYLKVQIDSSLPFIEEGMRLAKAIRFDRGELMMHNLMGNYYEHKTDFQKALDSYEKGVEIAKRKNDIQGFAILYNNIGMVHIRTGKYDVALPLMFEALKAEERLENPTGIAQSYNNIGVIYFYLKNFDKATAYFEKSIATKEQIGDWAGVKEAINNLGAIYDYLEQFPNAIAQYKRALQINEGEGNKREIATNLHNIAVSLFKQKKYDASRQYYDSAIAIKRVLEDYSGVALYYFNYGELLRDIHHDKEAEQFYKQALEIANTHDLKEIKQRVFGALARLYEHQGHYEKAFYYQSQLIAVKDSVINSENNKIIAEAETKYQTEKKEKELLSSKKIILENELELEQKNVIMIFSFSVATVLALIGYFVYQRQKSKNIQLRKEQELKEQVNKVETQNKLQQQRLLIARDLHDNIGSQLTFIISSIQNLTYSSKIKGTVDVSEKLQNLSGFTVNTISELRDTIWAMNRNSIPMEELLTRISNLVSNAQTLSSQFAFHLNTGAIEGASFHFSSIQGMNIYRIVQEAVQNAIKHSGGSIIDLDIVREQETLIVSITDNGKVQDVSGFDAGNGLGNMAKRASEIGAVCAVEAATPTGTRVRLQIPTALIQNIVVKG